MKLDRITYRIQQFWNDIRARPSSQDLEQIRSILTPAQMDLFTKMQASEQAHSLTVMKRLNEQKDSPQGEERRDLLVAALLHDVGKSRFPLKLAERVIIVLGKALFPEQVKDWGSGDPIGWRRAFVIAEQHPEWGAQMATEVGTSPLAVELIRFHQNFSPARGVFKNESLIQSLQTADQNS